MQRHAALAMCLFLVSSWTHEARGAAAGPLPPQAASVLDAYDRARSAHLQWAIKMQMTADAVEPDKPVAAATPVTIDWLYYKDNTKAAVRTVRREKGKVIGAYRTVIDGWYLSYPLPPPGQDANMAQFAPDGAARLGAAIPQGLPALDGFAAADYVSFVQIIRSAETVSATHDSLDGRDCILIHAISADHGDYRLWFDPALDFYPRKIIVQKSANNYWSGRRLNDAKIFASAKTGDPVGTRSITFTMDDATFDQVEGAWFPSQCHVSRVHVLEDGSSHILRGTCRRLSLDLHPQLANVFLPGVRQGARLSNLENPQIPHRWQDGKPVPLIDQATLQHMDNTADRLRQDTAQKLAGTR